MNCAPTPAARSPPAEESKIYLLRFLIITRPCGPLT
jgi:hypothetical protein